MKRVQPTDITRRSEALILLHGHRFSNQVYAETDNRMDAQLGRGGMPPWRLP